MGEFELIERFFKQPAQAGASSAAVPLGIGDDCALLQPAPGMQLAISTDMLVEGQHFFPEVNPFALGHKTLAVNLSDLAAMGAAPLGFTLALALPPERASDSAWLQALSAGMLSLGDQHLCPLIGGDTTAGPLNLCVTVFGQVPAGQALRRDGAQVGDDIWVSGTLGGARLALGAIREEWAVPAEAFAATRQRLERPTPRLALGLALRGVASACADVSDGLAGDLGHILKASAAGARLESDAVLNLTDHELMPPDRLADSDFRLQLALSGGDDYELVFTAPASARAAVQSAADDANTRVTRIGLIEAQPGLHLIHTSNYSVPIVAQAFDHFR